MNARVHLAVLVSSLSFGEVARADQPLPPGVFVSEGFGGVVRVPTNGVVAVLLHVVDVPADEIERTVRISIRTAEGADVPGTTRIVLLDEPIASPHAALAVWSREDDWPAGSQHEGTVEADGFRTNFSVQALSYPISEMPDYPFDELSSEYSNKLDGPRVCCSGESDTEVCTSTRVVPAALVRANVRGPDFLTGQAIHRVVFEPDTVSAWGVVGISLATYAVFTEEAPSYCAAIESESLIDGARKLLPARCVDGPGPFGMPYPNDVAADLEDRCDGQPYWEDTGEPYGPLRRDHGCALGSTSASWWCLLGLLALVRTRRR